MVERPPTRARWCPMGKRAVMKPVHAHLRRGLCKRLSIPLVERGAESRICATEILRAFVSCNHHITGLCEGCCKRLAAQWADR